MKKINQLFSLLFFLLLQASLFAQNQNTNDNNKKYEFVKNKSINKSYNVSSSEKLTIQNSFGAVEIHSWNKNEIKVEVSIETSSNKEELAQKIIDGIEVTEQQKGGEVSYKTNIKGSNNNKGSKSAMSVNYSVYMPASNPLTISNEFGATIVPDFTGEVDLTSKFGSLNTGDLKSVKKIAVEFGKANFESIANGQVSIKYSNAEFGKLVGKVKLNFEFCGATKVNIDGSLTALEVKADYSTVNIRPAANLSAAYHLFTSFGSFKNNPGIKFEEDKKDEDSGPKFDNTYDGKSGNGVVPVKVSTSFGKIILGEATAEDLKEKGKSKSKTV
jgi:hypothetical protein